MAAIFKGTDLRTGNSVALKIPSGNGKWEMLRDFQHQEEVGVSSDRLELHKWRMPKTSWQRKAVVYAGVALIPPVIFSLILYVAKHS